MPRFSASNPAKTFIDNSTYRGARRRDKPEYRISDPATLVESNQSPEIGKVVSTSPSSQNVRQTINP